MSTRVDDVVIGAGIAGLACAYALSRRGRRVAVVERSDQALGASVRNFGTLWPIGQPAGARRALALRSVGIWREVLREAGLWSMSCGSLHLAYADAELQVLSEFVALAAADGLDCDLLDPAEALARCGHVRAFGLTGALYSPHEVQVNPRSVIARLPAWLAHTRGVTFHWRTAVTACDGGTASAGSQRWHADRVWLTTGDELQTLYPEALQSLGLRRCKLQMMRTAPADWTLGPILAAGLTLLHYESFAQCPSLPALAERLSRRWPDQREVGIHVLVSQHDGGHLVLGDSHQYDAQASPFDQPRIDELILQYLATFLPPPLPPVVERWHGIYVKHPQLPYCLVDLEPSVTALVGLGGHGMTLSFGVAEDMVRERLD